MVRYIYILLISFLFTGCGEKAVKEYTVEVIKTYPHDTESYTQGLFFHEDQMYESTGIKGK
jgi:glutaminyl-peptide cyclotransferase